MLGWAPGLKAQFSSPGGGVDDSNKVFQMEGNVAKDSYICFTANSQTKNDGPAFALVPSSGNCPGGMTKVQFGSQTDDWALFTVNSSSLTGTHALATTGIRPDITNSGADNAFLGTSSKDTDDVSVWTWKTQKPQAKDDIAHAFAAAYSVPQASGPDHTVLYLGMTRYDDSGSSTAGFWLFQDSSVSLNSNGTFSGHHTVGDLLIVSDFTIGGAVSTINVFEWVGGANPLQLKQSVSPAPCNPISGNAPNGICGLVNQQVLLDNTGNIVTDNKGTWLTTNTPAPAGWNFSDKSGNTNALAVGEFLELAVDLNVVFPDGVPCFSLFMGETRSSTSTSASLSDLTTPASFPLCGISAAKSCTGSTLSAGGNYVTYTWSVTATNIGIGTLTNVVALDTFPGTNTAVSIPITSSLSAGAQASVTVAFIAGSTANPISSSTITSACSGFAAGTCTGGNVANPLSVVNTATVQATSAGGATITPVGAPVTATCSLGVNNGIVVDKHCDGTNGGPLLIPPGQPGNSTTFVVVKVPFTATVCNASGNEGLTGITLSDNPTATITELKIGANTVSAPFSLNANQCADVKGYYFPGSISSGTGVEAGRYFFSDTLTATGTGVLSGTTNISGNDSVSCPICPLGYCTTTALP